MKTIFHDTLVVGTGCAGYNAADWLTDLGRKDVAIVSEGRLRGTSRNTGSDKQTYYKLSLCGNEGDSAGLMAQTLASGKDVNGKIAFAEASGSTQSFMKLVMLGVEFPTDKYGQFVGYKTDHDPQKRGTSAGPLTSRQMTEALEKKVLSKEIQILDGYTVIQLIKEKKRICGMIAFYKNEPVYLKCNNIIWCTGGPSGIYKDVVYPESQRGMSGILLEQGVTGCNLQYWQYGIASVKFRWNLSGTYQQVLPRYVSIDEHGIEHEFLAEEKGKEIKNLTLEFLKGYQWPFDSRKIEGSSHIDLAVYHESIELNRKVFLDYRRNPSLLANDFSNLEQEAYDYLEKSNALFGTPLQRLKEMNPLAIDLYQSHGIDLSTDMLEIKVCAQSHNGGIQVDENWKTNFENLYVAGEAAGTFGAYRPGGTALNSGQVGSMRSARSICIETKEQGQIPISQTEQDALNKFILPQKNSGIDVRIISEKYKKAMSDFAGFKRKIPQMIELKTDIETLLATWETSVSPSNNSIKDYFTTRDQLLSSAAILSAMIYSAQKYGSTGGCVVDEAAFYKDPPREQLITNIKDTTFNTKAEKTEPLPENNTWFETSWAEYRDETNKIKMNCKADNCC